MYYDLTVLYAPVINMLTLFPLNIIIWEYEMIDYFCKIVKKKSSLMTSLEVWSTYLVQR